MFRTKKIADENVSNTQGKVDIVGLNFVDNMEEVMVAADVCFGVKRGSVWEQFPNQLRLIYLS